MKYFKENEPIWFIPVLSTAVTFVTMWLLSFGYVSFVAVVTVFCFTASVAFCFMLWQTYWGIYERRNKLHRENLPDYPLHTFYHGPEYSYQTLFYERLDQNEDPVPEYLIGSSFLFNGIVYTCMAPGRHYHCFRLIKFLKLKDEHVTDMSRNEGFMTSYGRHVDRREALIIAVKARQLIDKTGGLVNQLYSEDVWDTTRPFMPLDYFLPEGKGRPPINTDAVEALYKQYKEGPTQFEDDIRSGQYAGNV